MSPAKTILETGTTNITGPIFAITIIADAVFSVLTGMDGDTLAGVTFTAGITLYGNFTSVTLASGSIVVYKSHGN